jgi:hypothetical protein
MEIEPRVCKHCSDGEHENEYKQAVTRDLSPESVEILAGCGTEGSEPLSGQPPGPDGV